MAMQIFQELRSAGHDPRNASHAHALELLRKFLKSDEMTFGISPVHV